jgi:hypothetical protein
MQKSSENTKISKGDAGVVYNPKSLGGCITESNWKDQKHISLFDLKEKNYNGTIIFGSIVRLKNGTSTFELVWGQHQEFAFIYKQDDITYVVPMCRNVDRELLRYILPKDMDSEQEEMFKSLKDKNQDISKYINNLAYETKIVLVNPNVDFLQSDYHSCHIYADKVKKFAEENPEKVKEYLQPVFDAHPKVLEAINKNEPLPKIEINKHFEGYVKYAQRLSVLPQEDLSKLSPRYLVENEQGKIQNFRLNYHGLKKQYQKEKQIDKLQELKAFKNHKKDERNFVERLQMQREDKTLDIQKH